MDIRDILKQFNIERKEAEVYIASLELGTAPAAQIADKAGVFRTYFYEIADKLINEGLLKQIKKNGKHYFTAISPQELIRLQEKKLDGLKSIAPQLEAIHNIKDGKPKVYYYEGRKGIDEINNDTLRYRSEIIGFTTPRFYTTDQKKLGNEYIERRVAAGNRVRIIGELCQEMLDRKHHDKKELRETRMLPKELFHSEVEIGIYANKAYIINYKSEFGMIIEDKNIADVLKQIFELTWNSGRIVE